MKLNRWLKSIRATEEEEISCSECFDWVSDYVDTELAGAEMDGRLRRVQQHLQQCKACQDEYELLREMASMESDAPNPSLDGDLTSG